MPTLRQLEYLAALAETRHFRKAAERVGVRQPTMSAQISALEDRLGVQLVERNPSNVLLTPIGEQVLAIGRRILVDVEELRGLAARHRGAPLGAFRLGAPPTIGPYLLPRAIPALRRAHPQLKVHVREQTPARLSEALLDGAYDLILAPLPVACVELESAALFREPIRVAAPAEHRFARKGGVAPEDLAGVAVLALERGHQLQSQVEGLCAEFGATLLYDYEGTSLETLAQMTALGMGVSFLPGLFVAAGLDERLGLAALELKGRRLSRTIGVAWRAGAGRQDEREAVVAALRAAISADFPACALL